MPGTITENAFGFTDYTSIMYFDYNGSNALILNGTSSSITVGSNTVSSLSILEPEGTVTNISGYSDGIFLSGTGNGDYIDASESSLGIEYSFAQPKTEKDWQATVLFSDSSNHDYGLVRDENGVLDYWQHREDGFYNSIGFYNINDSVVATLDSNNTLTATAIGNYNNNIGTLTATNVTYITDGLNDDTFVGNDNANQFYFYSGGSDTVTAGDGSDFFVIVNPIYGLLPSDITITDYQAGEWVSLEEMGFDSATFSNQYSLTYDATANITKLAVNTESYQNDSILTLNGNFEVSSAEMGNRAWQSDSQSELLLQFIERSFFIPHWNSQCRYNNCWYGS